MYAPARSSSRGHLIALVVVTFLIGCAVLLLVVGCAGTSSDASKEQQGHTEATTKQDQPRSPEATESEEARCEGTRTYQKRRGVVKTTNDLPGCPKGGLLLGTDKTDDLYGGNGDDEIRGFGEKDVIFGEAGSDIIYAGPGDDTFLGGDDGPAESPGDDGIYGGPGDDEFLGGHGADVIYGGDGDDVITEIWERGADKLYCGKGKDSYAADKKDFVSSSCEKAREGP